MTEKTDAEKLADARAAVLAAQERLRAAQEAEAPVIAGAAEIAKAIQLPHAERFVAILAGKEAKAFRELLEAHVAESLDDIPKPSEIPGLEGTKQKADRLLTTMRLSLESAQTRVATLQPAPSVEAQPGPAIPDDA